MFRACGAGFSHNSFHRANSNRVLTQTLKRKIEVESLPGALKRSFPRINARAPTKGVHSLGVLPGLFQQSGQMLNAKG